MDICKQFALQIIMLTINHYIKPVEMYSHTQLSNRYLNSNQIIDSCTDINSVTENLSKILLDILDVFRQTQNISFSQNNLVAQVIEYIDESYMNPLTSLSATAEKFKVSDSHLSRVFKSSTGKRFTEYLIYKRVEKAKELLVSSQHKVNDISALVGYDNQISFMRIFKKYTGVTPSEYRSMYSEKNNV
ncbi:MAG: AraC family transcriptional regulator [Clostridia bacterium]|nr:AraC family transcriptional regulator [Clostridia bacterium]